MTIQVRRKSDFRLAQTLTIDQTSLIVDLSIDDGGDAAGPTPHDLYDSALAACKALSVMWYAARKHVPVDDIAVFVDRDGSQERAGAYVLTSRILVGGAVTDAQLKELLAVAEKCPVHKLMTTVKTTIRTSLDRMA